MDRHSYSTANYDATYIARVGVPIDYNECERMHYNLYDDNIVRTRFPGLRAIYGINPSSVYVRNPGISNTRIVKPDCRMISKAYQ